MGERANKVFIAGDLRFGDTQSSREDGFEEEFLKGWDAMVTNNDAVILLGDIALSSKAYWFGRIQKMPGKKVLMMGEEETNKINWYRKFGFTTVTPFNETMLIKYHLGQNDEGEFYEGNIMLSHIPAFASVTRSFDERFLGLSNKFQRAFDHRSAILNIHSHVQGKAKERHNTVDVSLESTGGHLVSIDQLFTHKFRR